VPDLKEMARAIEKHVAEHKKKDSCEGAQFWAPNELKQGLIEQLLKVAGNAEA
jgi:hypothetical protein